MKGVLLLSLVVLATAFHDSDLDKPLESAEIIDAVNHAKTTWTAGRNFDTHYTKRFIKSLMGLKRKTGESLPPLMDVDEDDDQELPKFFDVREKWKYCKSLHEVRDQGPCGSCWAVSAASTFTDRLCIATEGKFNGHLSEQDLLTCSVPIGCNGSSDISAWNYLHDTGICTGGDYKSQEGCQPYTIPACEHHVSGPRKNCSSYQQPYPTPACKNTCYNRKYTVRSKEQDLHKVTSVFSITDGNIKKIQREIYKNGPVQAAFMVFEDFLSYKSGVYWYTHGNSLDGHAVKVIGWGTENNTDYWLVANSWNSDWGDKGFFKIRRGTNECGFEDAINFGYPAL